MRLKLDENLGRRGIALLAAGGCDVASVCAEELCTASDETLIEVCRVEGRTLVSLDKDFANTLRFPPQRYSGLVVLRLPEPLTLGDIENALSRVLDLARSRKVVGRLWVVDKLRIREFAGPDDEG